MHQLDEFTDQKTQIPHFGVVEIDARVDGSHKNDFGDKQRDAQISMDAVSQATQISATIELVRVRVKH